MQLWYTKIVSVLSILSIGIIRLCKPDSSGLQSLIGVLYLPNMETRVSACKEIKKNITDIRFSKTTSTVA